MAEAVRIKLDDPGITPEDERAVLEVLRSGQIVAGPRVRELERALAVRTGRARAVAVSSGTIALYAAMEALGIGPGSTVVVPALTFPAPAVVASYLGARVTTCDVDPETLNISPETLAPLLDERVSLVVAIDQFGNPAPVPELEDLLRPLRVPVLVDGACSLGSSLGGRPCGGFGEAAIFSFHPRKVITTGEGGLVLTDDSRIADRARTLRNVGMDRGTFRALGLNLRPSELGAALGLSQLQRLDRTLERRRQLARRYRERLGALRFQKALSGAEHNVQTMVAVLPAGLDEPARDEMIDAAREAGIEIGIASYSIGELGWLAERLEVDGDDLPGARAAHRRGIALPLHAETGEAEVEEVCDFVRDWLDSRGGEA